MIRQRFRHRYDGCGKLVIETRLRLLEGRGHVEDLVAVLDRHNSAAREAAAVAAPVDLVDDRRLEVAAPQEIGVQRVGVPTVDRSRWRRPAPVQDLTLRIPARSRYRGSRRETG
jgi:hypothetical protein